MYVQLFPCGELAKASIIAKHKDTKEKLQSKLKDTDAKLLRAEADTLKIVHEESLLVQQGSSIEDDTRQSDARLSWV